MLPMDNLLAFDISLMRPACVLVAAGMGANTRLAHEFPLNSWLLAPTDNMRVYRITDEQLTQLIQKVKNRPTTEA